MTQRAKPPPPPGSERRQHPRFEVLAQVEIRGGENTLVVPVRNISVGGLYVDLDDHDPAVLGASLAAGQRATIFFDASDGDDELVVSREADILRIDRPEVGRGGMAMRWTAVEPEVAEHFARVLEVLRRRAGLPDTDGA
jgi:hypothetical protein